MKNLNSNLFKNEKNLLKEAKELIKNKEHDKESLLNMLSNTIEHFDKLVRDVEKIIKISDGQQEYLHRIQSDLKKEIEDRIRAEEKLRYFAAIDTLTGCYNRGMGLTFLANEINAIKRNKGYFSICYIDVNGLKNVNDNFGHFEGDELLVLVCRFLKHGIRDNDILCRLGGDEFIILFPNMKEDRVEQIVKNVSLNIEVENKKKLKNYEISFSYGIVQVDYTYTGNIDEIIQRADEKMYDYKQKYKKVLCKGAE